MRIKIYFVINAFVLSLASKQRLRATQSEMVYSVILLLIINYY